MFTILAEAMKGRARRRGRAPNTPCRSRAQVGLPRPSEGTSTVKTVRVRCVSHIDARGRRQGQGRPAAPTISADPTLATPPGIAAWQ